MKSQLKDIILPLLLTLLLLAIFEIFTTTFLPLLGLHRYTIPFSILFVLYLGFKLETPYLPVMVLIVQYVHHIFSIEGWETGTVSGILVCLLISYLRDLIHFNSIAMTVFVTQVFQTIWFLIVSALIYLRMGSFEYIIDKFWRFIPESIMISILAPIIFALLDRLWRSSDEGRLGESL